MYSQIPVTVEVGYGIQEAVGGDREAGGSKAVKYTAVAAAAAELFDLVVGTRSQGIPHAMKHQESKLSGAEGTVSRHVSFFGCLLMEARWGEQRPEEAS